MATEETKLGASEDTSQTGPGGSNYVSGDKWICKLCGMTNNIGSWKCIACFTSMKKSMQSDNASQRRNQQKQTAVRQKRQAKRDAVKKRKQANSTKKESSTPTTKKTEDESKEKPKSKDNDDKKTNKDTDSKEKERPKYKLSENIPKTMKALVKEKEGKGYELREDYPVPVPAEDELLVRSFAVAICGSDNILYNWTKDAQAIAKLPFIPGHEAAGLIVGVGRDCRFRIGERVAIENHFYCGECYQCKIGRKDICANLQQFGHGKGTIYGGCCEYYTVKEKYAYKLKQDISWRDAALLEPLGVAHNACEQCDLNPSDRKADAPKESLLIVGCGAIGCMAIGVAKTMPITGTIIACDVVEDKLAIAKKMGADITFNPKNLKCSLKEKILELTDNVGVGRIIECSGHAPTICQIFGCLRKGGCITLVGLPKAPLTIENPLQDIIFKSTQIRTVHGRRIFRTWNKTEKLVADRKIILDPLVSLELPINEFEKGYDSLKSGKALKVVFNLTK